MTSAPPARSVPFAALLIAVVALLQASIAADRLPLVTAGIIVFENARYSGAQLSLIRDVPDLRAYHFEDRISSFVIAAGEIWEMCQDRNYSGHCETFSGYIPDLADRHGWNDRISSIRRVRQPAYPSYPNYPGYPSPSEPIGGLELFAGTRFSGQSIRLGGPAPDLGHSGFNDRAMSVRVPRGQVWEICVNANYDDCRVVDHDVPDLGTLGVNRLVSSARPRYR